MNKNRPNLPDHPLINKAIELAETAHRGQVRKSDPGTPYIVHPFETAELIYNYSEFRNEPRVIAAALLHDAVEDGGLTFKDFTEAFGDEDGTAVYDMVKNLTVPEEIKQSGRKEEWQVNKMSILTPAEQQIKLADRCLSNIKSMILASPKEWTLKKRISYVEQSEELVKHSSQKNSVIGMMSTEICKLAKTSVKKHYNTEQTQEKWYFKVSHIIAQLPRSIAAFAI